MPSGSGQRIINRLLKTWSKSWPPCLFWVCPMPRIYSYWTRTPTILPCHRGRAKSSTARQGVSDFLCQQDIESWSEEILHNLEGVIEPSGVYPPLSTVPTLWKSHGTDRPCKLSLANGFQVLRWFDITMVAGVGTVWFFHCAPEWKKHSNADGLPCYTLEGYYECYVAGKDLSTLPCGGCEFCTQIHS